MISDTTSILATKLKDIINALPTYTAVLSNPTTIHVVSKINRSEIDPIFRFYSTEVLATITVIQQGSNIQPEIFDIEFTQKPTMNGKISLILNGEMLTVQKTKLQDVNILNTYILVLYPRANLLKDLQTSYNSERKRNIIISIYVLALNEDDSIRIVSDIEYYLSNNMDLLSKEGLRLSKIIDISPLSDTNVLGYVNSSQKIYANILTLRGFCMF